MRRVALVLIIAVVAISTQWAWSDVKLVNESITKMNGEVQNEGEQTSYYTSDKARMEDPQGKVTIIRLDEKKMWIIDPENKTYQEQTFKQLSDQMSMIPPEMLKIEKDVDKTDEKKKIGDYKCIKIVTTIKMMGTTMTFNSWVTKDIKVDQAMVEFSNNAEKAFKDIPMMQTVFGMIKDFTDEGYFPVQMTNEMSMMGMKTENVTTFKSMSNEDIKDSMFEIPEGYKKQDMPGMMGGGKEE